MFSIEITEKLHKDIERYCQLNDIDDIGGFCIKMLVQGFNIEKYGVSPFIKQIKPIEVKEDKKPRKSSKVENNIELPIEEVEKPKKRIKIIKK